MARMTPEDCYLLFDEARNNRMPLENDYRLAAAYCMPRQYGSWQSTGSPANRQQATARLAYDNTGIKSLPKFVAILLRLIMPMGQRYQILAADNDKLMKIHRVRTWFEEATDKLFKYRNAPGSGFLQAAAEAYASIGVYGMGPQSVMWGARMPGERRGGLVYNAWRMAGIYILVDDRGAVTHVFRAFWLKARQAVRKFGKETLPDAIQKASEISSRANEDFEFVHYVCLRDDHDPKTLYIQRFPWTGGYLAVAAKAFVGEEEGTLANLYLTPRTASDPEEPYGYSPAMQALPALGGVSQMKKTMLKGAHKAVDPAYIAHDDGALSGNMDIRPGAINFGGVDSQGRRLMYRLESGEFQPAETLLQDERKDIEDNFLVTLFQLLIEKEMTAREVIEMVAERASLLAPTMGRLQDEDLAYRTHRELGLMVEHGELGAMPPELIEAAGEYKIEYASPLARAMHSDEVSSFFRLVEILVSKAAQTGDSSDMDHLNMDAAIPEVGRYMAVRNSWISSPEMVTAKREGRAQAAKEEALIKQAPALASVATTAMKQQNGAQSARR